MLYATYIFFNIHFIFYIFYPCLLYPFYNIVSKESKNNNNNYASEKMLGFVK